ncbi:hypothetical protein SCALM49S_04048 [Streptomyces californicus]
MDALADPLEVQPALVGDDDLPVDHAARRKVSPARRRPGRGSSGSATCPYGCRARPRRRPGRRSSGSRPTSPRTPCPAGSSPPTWRASASGAASPAGPWPDCSPSTDRCHPDVRHMCDRPTVAVMGAAVELDADGRAVEAVQPGQGVLPGEGLHQEGRGRVLPGRGARHHPGPQPPAHHPPALRGRRRGRLLLPEARPEEPPRVDPDRADRLPQRTVGRREPEEKICPTELAAVLWAANLGTLTFHPWPVRAGDTDHPDELRIDLDPQPGTGYADAVTAAHELRSVLEDHGLRGWPKTSGGRGMHVFGCTSKPAWTFTEAADATRHRRRARAGAPDARPGDHGLVEGGARGADLRRFQPDVGVPEPGAPSRHWSSSA